MKFTHNDRQRMEDLSMDLFHEIFTMLDDMDSGIDSDTAGKIAGDACKAFELAFEQHNAVCE